MNLKATNQHVDYLTFVPDGEPTLDSGLARRVALLKPFDVPIAIITNGSLLLEDDVRSAVAKADRVSVKVDSVSPQTWHGIDRPHGDLQLERVLDGVLQFARRYEGELDTETMLVAGINDSEDDAWALAAFLGRVKPKRSYVSIPTRPPAERSVAAPLAEAVVRTYGILKSAVATVELLVGFEGVAFASGGDIDSDLLAITSVHPMRRDQVEAFVNRAGGTIEVADRLVRQHRLTEVTFEGQRFYVRRFRSV